MLFATQGVRQGGGSRIDRMSGLLGSQKAPLYTLKAQAYFAQKDTAAAMASIDRALEINPYEATGLEHACGGLCRAGGI